MRAHRRRKQQGLTDGHVSDKWEHYLPIYDTVLANFIARRRAVRLLEIGVQNGGLSATGSLASPIRIETFGSVAKLAQAGSISIPITVEPRGKYFDQICSDIELKGDSLRKRRAAEIVG